MKRAFLVLVAVLLAWSPLAAADRLTDRDLKKLVERIDDGRHRFEDALDDKIKHNVLRGPSGEVDVERYLHDFDDNIDRLKDRLKPDYAASAEAATVLRQATAIDNFLRQQPAGVRGESEWNRLTTDLKTLAGAYGTAFPVADSTPVRRIGDGELAGVANEISRAGQRLKKSLENDLKNDAAVDKQARQMIVDEAEQFSKDGKALRERIKSGEPSSAEADRVLAGAFRLETFLVGHRAAASSTKIWSDITTRLQSLAGAYRESWPPGR
jgi:hypothetical protein